MAVLVYETDLGVYLNKNAKLSNISFKAGEAMVTIEIDGVNKLTGSNLLLVQRVQDLSFPIVKAEAAKLITKLKTADDVKDAKKRDAAVDKELEAFNGTVAPKLITAAQGVFTSFAKDKKDYKIYKIKSGFKIVINGLTLAASIALIGLAGWTGVGTVVGVVGMVRTSASLVQQIINLGKDSEQILQRIGANRSKLQKQLASPAIRANTAKQVAATVANKVFAVEIQSIVVTVDGVESDLKLLANKVKGNRVNLVNLADQLKKLLDKQDDLTADINKLVELGVLTKKQTSEVAKLEALRKNVETATKAVLDKLDYLREGVATIERVAVEEMKKLIKLKSKYNANVVKGAGFATDFLMAGVSFVGGNFSDPASTVKDLYDGGKSVLTALSLVNDGLGTIKDLGASTYSAFKG